MTQWQPGIGDPSFMGWLTVVAYLGTAAACLACATRLREALAPEIARRNVAFWRVMAVTMLILGINKQLDLQSWFTFVAKDLARAQGWYEHRRMVQVVFIAFVGLVGMVLAASSAWVMRRDWARTKLAIVGLAFLLVFVVTRAVSFHHIDHLLGSEVGFLEVNWLLELSGIGLVAASALHNLRH